MSDGDDAAEQAEPGGELLRQLLAARRLRRDERCLGRAGSFRCPTDRKVSSSPLCVDSETGQVWPCRGDATIFRAEPGRAWLSLSGRVRRVRTAVWLRVQEYLPWPGLLRRARVVRSWRALRR